MRAARTGFIVISWVSGALQHQWRQMSSKMTCQRTQHRFQIPIQFQRERERERERQRDTETDTETERDRVAPKWDKIASDVAT